MYLVHLPDIVRAVRESVHPDGGYPIRPVRTDGKLPLRTHVGHREQYLLADRTYHANRTVVENRYPADRICHRTA